MQFVRYLWRKEFIEIRGYGVMVSIRVSKTFDESSSLSTPAKYARVCEWLSNWFAKPSFVGSSPATGSKLEP